MIVIAILWIVIMVAILIGVRYEVRMDVHRFRREGYEEAVKDIFEQGIYWDFKEEKYKDVER
jgi:hypothetical protein